MSEFLFDTDGMAFEVVHPSPVRPAIKRNIPIGWVRPIEGSDRYIALLLDFRILPGHCTFATREEAASALRAYYHDQGDEAA